MTREELKILEDWKTYYRNVYRKNKREVYKRKFLKLLDKIHGIWNPKTQMMEKENLIIWDSVTQKYKVDET